MKMSLCLIALGGALALLLTACTPAAPVTPESSDASSISSTTQDSGESSFANSTTTTNETTGGSDNTQETQDTTGSTDDTTSNEESAPESTTSRDNSDDEESRENTTASSDAQGTTSTVGNATTSTVKNPTTSTTKKPTTSTTKKPTTSTTKTVTTSTTKKITTTTTKAPVTGDPVTPLSPSKYYGLSVLKAKSNSQKLVAAYQKMVECVESMASSASFKDCGELTEEELKLVYSCYRNDYPHHFWLGNGYSYSSVGDKNHITSWKPKHNGNDGYLMTSSEKHTAKTKFDAAVNKIVSKLHTGMSEFERELAIHDALVNFCSYDTTLNGKYSHSAYGALVVGSAVCEGYAYAFQYLLNLAGIQAITVTGTGNGGPHAWNMMKIDGDWYHTDITWDDPVSKDPLLFYAYFNVTEAQILKDHAIDHAFPVPKATATAANYHRVHNSIVTTFSVDQLAQILKTQESPRIFVDGDFDAYKESLKNNLSAAMRQAGRFGSVSYVYSGQEIWFRFQS